MSSFPAGVAVVTTCDAHGAKRGLTTTAVCSVSIDPPMVLACVDRSSRTLPALLWRREFVLNFLRWGEHQVGDLFASKGDEKFADVGWTLSPRGLPALTRHTLSWVECELSREIEAGDHVILIGAVTAIEPPYDAHEPLLYCQRSYGGWSPLEP
ncbi:MAG: flavin reductase family protein [Actinobacteria bacterium]|nr:flavin reductase family protein [Actinomycetota bacterium]